MRRERGWRAALPFLALLPALLSMSSAGPVKFGLLLAGGLVGATITESALTELQIAALPEVTQ